MSHSDCRGVLDIWPALQSRQIGAPSFSANCPGTQSTHWYAALAFAYLPAVQFSQPASWLEAAKVPAVHTSHPVEPSFAEYCPRRQLSQTARERPLVYRPASQIEHSVNSKPGPKYPGTHGSQSSSSRLPCAGEPMALPGPHRLQLAPPASS